MNEIKRWDIDCMSAQMDEFSDGGYVSLDDHEAEVARLRAELQNATKAALDATALACEKEREADALRKDAERYRWVRSPFATNIESLIGMHCDGELDYQIDKAMGDPA